MCLFMISFIKIMSMDLRHRCAISHINYYLIKRIIAHKSICYSCSTETFLTQGANPTQDVFEADFVESMPAAQCYQLIHNFKRVLTNCAIFLIRPYCNGLFTRVFQSPLFSPCPKKLPVANI